MAYEVERKAWVHDWEAMEQRLRAICRFDREFRKEDRYFSFPGNRPDDFAATLRIRSDGDHAYVTFKEKEFRGGGEVNLEHEFGVDDASALVLLLDRLHCAPIFSKVKEGIAFSHEGLTVELSRVERLGSFIEVERVLDADDASEVAGAEAEVRRFFDELGVSRSDVEPEPYMKLLREAE